MVQMWYSFILKLCRPVSYQPKHETQFYYFLSEGNPKTVLKGGYVGWRGGSSFASLRFERWLVGL